MVEREREIKITVLFCWKCCLQNNNQGGIFCSLGVGASCNFYALKLFLIKTWSVKQTVVQDTVKAFECANNTDFPEDH